MILSRTSHPLHPSSVCKLHSAGAESSAVSGSVLASLHYLLLAARHHRPRFVHLLVLTSIGYYSWAGTLHRSGPCMHGVCARTWMDGRLWYRYLPEAEKACVQKTPPNLPAILLGDVLFRRSPAPSHHHHHHNHHLVSELAPTRHSCFLCGIQPRLGNTTALQLQRGITINSLPHTQMPKR